MKKVNACLGILSAVFLFLHSVYQAVSYAFLIYSPVVTRIFADSLALLVFIHGTLGFISVFGKHDSRKIHYPKLNIKTVLQRYSMYIIGILLIPHFLAWMLLSKANSRVLFALLECIQVLFFGSLFLHTAVSFTRALISLGLVTEEKTVKRIDTIMYVVCALCFLITAVVIVAGQSMLIGGM